MPSIPLILDYNLQENIFFAFAFGTRFRGWFWTFCEIANSFSFRKM